MIIIKMNYFMTNSVNAVQEKVIDLQTMREDSLTLKQSVYSSVAKANHSIILRYKEEVRVMENIAAQKSYPTNPASLSSNSSLSARMTTFPEPTQPNWNRAIIDALVNNSVFEDDDLYQYMQNIEPGIINAEDFHYYQPDADVDFNIESRLYEAFPSEDDF